MFKFSTALAVACLLCGAATAQTTTSEAGANSSSQSGAQAGSQSVFNNYADGKSTVKYEGGYDVTNVPSVAAPGVITAHNCALGASGGASGSGFGISFGGSYVDEDCQRISEAAALNQLVGAKVAVRHLANDPDICKTLRGSGIIPANSLCTNDEKRAATKSGPLATSVRPVARSTSYSKCQMNDKNQIVIRYKSGADKQLAQAQCLASLGY